MINVDVKRLPHGADLPLPAYATASSAGIDLLAAVEATVVLQPAARAMIPTGIAIALPEGHEAQVRPRSGLAARHGVTVLNSPGTIDADYRGEICVILINHGGEPVVIDRGMRIAQMVVAAHARVAWREAEPLGETDRGGARGRRGAAGGGGTGAVSAGGGGASATAGGSSDAMPANNCVT